MPGDTTLQKLGKAYKEACSPTTGKDSGDSLQESERVINSAYENTVNQGHPTPLAKDLNRRELRSSRYYHTVPQERDSIPSYEAPLPPSTNMTEQTSHMETV